MNILKYLKLIVLNILLLLIAVCLLEFILYNTTKQDLEKELSIKVEMCKKSNINFKSKISYSLRSPLYNYIIEKNFMRKPVGLNYKKGAIVLFGCSYTYGDGLEDTQTFSYKLSNYTKRPVYNRAMLGWGTQHILYQLRRSDFYNEIKPPEYVIYTIMHDHLPRLFRPMNPPPFNYLPLRYKLVNGQFVEYSSIFAPVSGMYTVNYIGQFIEKNITMSVFNEDRNLDYFYQMLIECKRLLNIKYPKAKFVILIYRENDNMFIDNNNLLNKLKKSGFIAVDSDELTPHLILRCPEYQVIDKVHPSEKAWDLIVPKLVKKLNL